MREPMSLSACSSTTKRRRSSLTLTACSSTKRRRSSPTKRRRRLATSEIPDAPSSSWASLSGDLLPLIGWRLLATGDLLDYVHFRAVCPHWRSSTLCPRSRGILDPRFHPRRWMMLPEGHGLYPGHRKLRGYIRFFNLSTDHAATLVRSKLHPRFKNHSICNTVDGLLLLQRDEDTAIRLLHPFTDDFVEIPPLMTLINLARHLVPKNFRHSFLGHVSAASLSVSADGVITLMMALLFSDVSCLAFATPGDEKWSVARWKLSPMSFNGPISFQGKLYMLGNPSPYPPVDCSETPIFRIDPPPPDHQQQHYNMPRPKLIAKCPSGKMMRPFRLTECNSEILVIGFGDPDYSTILVYRLADLVLGKVAPLTSIGQDTVTLMNETTLSVSSRLLPNVDGNSIVTFNYKEGYLGQYHLGSATWSRVVDGSITRCVTGPRSLICHVFTCCHRFTWKRGAITFAFEGNSTPLEKMRLLGNHLNDAAIKLVEPLHINWEPLRIFSDDQLSHGG